MNAAITTQDRIKGLNIISKLYGAPAGITRAGNYVIRYKAEFVGAPGGDVYKFVMPFAKIDGPCVDPAYQYCRFRKADAEHIAAAHEELGYTVHVERISEACANAIALLSS
jgi:hypothetical protein